jgi:N utilization substance protein B
VGQSRRAARRAAVFFLYQQAVTGLPLDELRENARRAGEGLDTFGDEIVAGVLGDLGAIDAEIGAASTGWDVERIAPLERSILRVAVHEIRSRGDIPAAVAVNEAVEIAKRYCQADAGGFVNGILGTIARAHDEAEAAGD